MHFFPAGRLSTEKGHQADSSTRLGKGGAVSCGVVVGQGYERNPPFGGAAGQPDGADLQVAAWAQAGVVVQVGPNCHSDIVTADCYSAFRIRYIRPESTNWFSR